MLLSILFEIWTLLTPVAPWESSILSFFHFYGKCTPRSSGRWQELIYLEWATSLPYTMTFLQNGLFLERVRENENSAAYRLWCNIWKNRKLSVIKTSKVPISELSLSLVTGLWDLFDSLNRHQINPSINNKKRSVK